MAKPMPEAANKLRNALFEVGLTQTKAARSLGIHPNTLNRYCTGSAGYHPIVLAAIYGLGVMAERTRKEGGVIPQKLHFRPRAGVICNEYV